MINRYQGSSERENDKLEAVAKTYWVVCKYGEIRGIGLKEDMIRWINQFDGYQLREVRVELL